MRVVFSGGKWSAAPYLQNTDGHAAAGQAYYHPSYEVISGHQRSGDGCFMELQGEQENSSVSASCRREMEDVSRGH
jgi:hypothetical protein